ncbi:OLC1v1008538C1 [Oldenlandia corymbosa var. corymbosa]|uniref:OLC1v1008538C1 n=1 Tax=Oldenlandia corymbosa var. corymbosa TaxID=529605 RepID=A0AAV1DLU7_OLDCO|nr:OLC1v1008538C1 [Oldenlandia corymbosa var. corymbosa]
MFASFFQKLSAPEAVQSSLIKQVKFINGTPTLEYEDDEFEKLIAPHRLSLVGKFSYGRPKMEEIHKEFKKIGFNGDYTLGFMNPRHILNRFEEEDDYQRAIAKPANESQLQTLAAVPEARAGESTSGLSKKEKSDVPVDVSNNPTLVDDSENKISSSPPMAEEAPVLENSNRYAALEEVSVEVVDEEEVVKVADVFEEDAMLSHEIQNISELVEAPRDVPLLATTSPLDVGTYLDDGVLGMSADDDYRVNIDE